MFCLDDREFSHANLQDHKHWNLRIIIGVIM